MNYSEQMADKDKDKDKDTLIVFEGLAARITSDVEPAIMALHESLRNLSKDIANIIDLRRRALLKYEEVNKFN